MLATTATTFQSTPPARGATGGHGGLVRSQRISIHAPREGGDARQALLQAAEGISIHAPREGGDCRTRRGTSLMQYFNPRPPRGGRHEKNYDRLSPYVFQSTPPARGATSLCRVCAAWISNFNPRPPRGGRLFLASVHRAGAEISIHAPREGGDRWTVGSSCAIF